MRRRIIAALLPLLLLVMAVAVAVAGALVSERNTRQVQVDRSGDATRFATTIADSSGPDQADRISDELAAYTQLYDSPVWVLGLDGGLLHDPGTPLPDDSSVNEAIALALAGTRGADVATVWPWSTGPIHVVEPVGRDSQVTAVVVIEAPTEQLRAKTWRDWGLGIAAVGLPLLALFAALWPLTRWILRPVEDLSVAAATISAGDLSARADADRGPPELRQLADGFNTMVTTVQQTLERQRSFVADAAHQLRNPLAGMRLSLDALSPAAANADHREAYADAVAEGERMSAMFDAMLAATVAGADQLGPVRAVREVITDGRERWAAILAEFGMELEVGPVPAELTVREPIGGLAGAIDELVSNAARLSNGQRLRIETRSTSGTAEVIVADDGTGIQPDDLSAATGRFWRADHHQNVSGTGLGLAILSEAVSAVGGELKLHNDGGLVVTVELLRAGMSR